MDSLQRIRSERVKWVHCCAIGHGYSASSFLSVTPFTRPRRSCSLRDTTRLLCRKTHAYLSYTANSILPLRSLGNAWVSAAISAAGRLSGLRRLVRRVLWPRSWDPLAYCQLDWCPLTSKSSIHCLVANSTSLQSQKLSTAWGLPL